MSALVNSLPRVSTLKLHRFKEILDKANTPAYRKQFSPFGRYWAELNPMEKAIHNELERRRGVPASQRTWPE